jgi:hypothetical protein
MFKVWRWNPIVQLFGDDHSQRSLAEGLQVIQQLLYPNTLFVTPRVTFSNPFTTEALAQMGDRMLDGMIVQARSLLECHMAQEKLLPASTS